MLIRAIDRRQAEISEYTPRQLELMRGGLRCHGSYRQAALRSRNAITFDREQQKHFMVVTMEVELSAASIALDKSVSNAICDGKVSYSFNIRRVVSCAGSCDGRHESRQHE